MRAAEPPATVLELARHEHAMHLRLVDSVQAQRGLADRATGAGRIAADLRRHSQAEHTTLLTLMLSDEQARPLARQAVAAHERLHRLLSDLTCRAYDELGFEVALATYRGSFLEYARFEEEELFPAATLALGPERCRQLAESFRSSAAEPHEAHMLAR